MSKLRIVDAKTLEKILFYYGFDKVRQKGSHAFYRHSDGRTTTIPHHGNRPLARPLIREILRECEIAIDDYHQKLDEI